jgi:hypothetical protein
MMKLIPLNSPPGVSLSPLLFIIYANDLLNLKLKHSTIISFADVTAAIFSERLWDEVHDIAEQN